MPNAQTLIEDAYSEIRVKSIGYDLSNEEAQLGLRTLNRMLQKWATKSLLIPYRTREEGLALTASQATYTIGTGGDLNTTRPLEIHEATLRQSNVDYPVQQVAYNRFEWEIDKNSTGRPSIFYYEPAEPLGNLYFNPNPDQAYTLILTSVKPLTTFTALTTADSLPDEYEEVVVQNLAVRLGPHFGKDASQTTQRMAMQGLKDLMDQNAAFRVPRLTIDRALQQRYRHNINSGEF